MLKKLNWCLRVMNLALSYHECNTWCNNNKNNGLFLTIIAHITFSYSRVYYDRVVYACMQIKMHTTRGCSELHLKNVVTILVKYYVKYLVKYLVKYSVKYLVKTSITRLGRDFQISETAVEHVKWIIDWFWTEQCLIDYW